MIWGYPYFWKHPYIISFHFRAYLRIAETLRDTLHSTHAFVRHLRRLWVLESGFSLLPNDPNQQWPMDPWLIGLILNRGHLLRLLIIHDAKSRNYCRITWAGFLSWLLHRVFTLCSGPLNFRVSWHHEVPARCISRWCDPWKAADGGALASTCRHKWLCQCCISPISTTDYLKSINICQTVQNISNAKMSLTKIRFISFIKSML